MVLYGAREVVMHIVLITLQLEEDMGQVLQVPTQVQAGGAYGGNGGKGCYDNGDTPGAGGALYGTDEGDDINMGSSGANSINTKGGAGGGMIEVNATWVYNNGDVNFDGNPGQLPGGSNGGGGGAGGGIKVRCKHITNDSLGKITAIGGQPKRWYWCCQ